MARALRLWMTIVSITCSNLCSGRDSGSLPNGSLVSKFVRMRPLVLSVAIEKRWDLCDLLGSGEPR